MKIMRRLLWLGLLLAGPLRAEVIAEHILFLDDDARGYLHYFTTRSHYSNYNLYYPRDGVDDPETHLANVLYVYPNDYRWIRQGNKDLLRFDQGSYALMRREEMGENLTRNEDGTLVYRSWNGNPEPDGHFGFWNKPNDFDQFVYVWVIPEQYEPVSWKANRKGEWVRRYNTLSWFGRKVNDITFEIALRPRQRETLERVQAAVGGQKGVQVESTSGGVRVTLGGTILFPSGDASLSDTGKWLLDRVAQALREREGVQIAVNGYTDDRPIRGALKRRYASNWELSAARALTVLHYLAERGFPESRLEARAYGERNPRASNASEIGRALNRRIELMIVEGGDRRP